MKTDKSTVEDDEENSEGNSLEQDYEKTAAGARAMMESASLSSYYGIPASTPKSSPRPSSVSSSSSHSSSSSQNGAQADRPQHTGGSGHKHDPEGSRTNGTKDDGRGRTGDNQRPSQSDVVHFQSALLEQPQMVTMSDKMDIDGKHFDADVRACYCSSFMLHLTFTVLANL